MEREIKFRAWVEPTEPFMCEAPYMVTQGGPDVETFQSFMFHYSDEKNLMQYTGLKDRNGKEIYEGDIVKATELGIDENFMQTDEVWSERNAEVFWDSLLCGWGLRGESFERGCEPLTHLDQFEVMGNIYETPELLNSVRGVQECDASKGE